MKSFLKTLLAIALVFASLFNQNATAQTTDSKVVLQAFWWDYWNSNHPGSWANYLTELAPRLRAMGIDAIWIPPISKGNTGEGSVGYDIFDHYDLGDKFQKSSLNTRIGTKDELLRMIAVMHANGIEVIQDVVLNHTIGAGDLDGSLGQDPAAPDDKYKNFRYASFGNHAVYKSTDNYLGRSGRWPKNHQNFHPNPDHNCNTGDICSQYFGPDICYYTNAKGQSSNATYNPTQSADYMRNEARNWVIWLKKQTGVDGFRWDATKHFPEWVQQDLSYNLKYNAGWASGGEDMFNVGEYVDFNGSNLDAYVNSVTTANGGSDFLMGTFDFSLRAGIKSMIDNAGFYNMALLPGTQQNARVAYYSTPNLYVHRTVPFVNNHDTFRPQLDANGNYIGWNSGSELAPHIDPFNDRMPLAYAMAFAVDGSPQVFFEDLFDIGGTSKRWSHEPTNSTNLPVRNSVEKIITLHQQLDFKSGAYKVRSTAGGGNVWFPPGSSDQDLLIIERSGKALVGLNDNGTTLQEAWVDTDFPPNTILVDYTGYVSGSSVVQSDQRALIKAPPVDPTNGTYGFSIWAPAGSSLSLPPAKSITQEWEMNDDLGDSHPLSLKQGGRIPDNSTAWRYAGKIFVETGKQVSFELYLADISKDLTIEFVDYNGSSVHLQNAVGNQTGSFTPTSTGWLDMRIKNTTSQVGQVCWLKVTYTAPAAIPDVSLYPSELKTAEWKGTTNTQWHDPSNWLNNNLPTVRDNVIIPSGLTNYPEISTNVSISALTIAPNATCIVQASGTLTADIISIEANSSGYGIMQSIGTTMVNDNINHQQFLDGNGWHQITPTVANRPVSDWGTIGADAPGGTANTKNLYTWDATAPVWTNVADGTSMMNTGVGYNLFVGNYGVMANSGLQSVTGDLISSYTPILHFATSAALGDGWNFIGNALSAPLDFTSLTKTNLNNAFYIWDPITSAYKSWSGGGIANPFIAPMQGFWVQADGNGTPDLGTINYTNTTTSATAFYKGNTIEDHVVLNLQTQNKLGPKDQLTFGLLDGAKDGFDKFWDAKKRLNGEDGINLYSAYGEDKMAINVIAFKTENQTYKTFLLGVDNLSEGKTYCIEFDPTYLNQLIYVYILDSLQNELHDLSSPFCFKAGENTPKALVLSHVKLESAAEMAPTAIAYATRKNLMIRLQGSSGSFNLFDVNGRILMHGKLDKGENTFSTPRAPGLYFVEVTYQNGHHEVLKVVL